MPAATANPVLDALRADFESKRNEVAKINADPNSSDAQLKKANTLVDELPGIKDRIEQMEAIKGKLDAADDWARQPAGNVPTWGNHARKTADLQMDGYKVPGTRIDHVSSPEERLMMTGGFKGLGHFAWCQYKAGRNSHGGDPSAIKSLNDWDGLQTKMHNWEMERKTPSGMFELSDPDGGLLVPPQFSNTIYERMVATNDLLRLINPQPTGSNVVKRRAIKEDSRVDGQRGGGILGYWENEADQYQKSKTQFRPVEYNIYKLTVFSFVTDEEMMDANISIDDFIGKLAAKEINYKINDAIINGTGAGQPLGILNSNSKITQAAVSGQGAGTIVAANILSMRSRVIAGQRGSLVWLYGQDSEPQLFSMFQSTGTAAGVLFFTPNQDGNLNFFGKPALVIEQAKTLGTAGDIIAFATDGYAASVRGGLQSFMSIHLRFDFDETALKWRFRMGGRPWDDSAMTLANGSTTVSSIVVLNSTRT